MLNINQCLLSKYFQNIMWFFYLLTQDFIFCKTSIKVAMKAHVLKIMSFLFCWILICWIIRQKMTQVIDTCMSWFGKSYGTFVTKIMLSATQTPSSAQEGFEHLQESKIGWNLAAYDSTSKCSAWTLGEKQSGRLVFKTIVREVRCDQFYSNNLHFCQVSDYFWPEVQLKILAAARHTKV